jgi:crotonobetainyl-CoA:carnitine CoA-transferase CaiB-like acyl-CoA transferase
MLAAGNDGQFRKLCEAMGKPELAADARFATNDARVRNRDTLIGILQQEFALRPVAQWTEQLSGAGVPSGPINDIAGVFADPQVQHRGMRVEVDHPLAGRLPLLGNPLHLSETPAQYDRPPPLLGAHTDEVLREILGLEQSQIESLRQQNIV